MARSIAACRQTMCWLHLDQKTTGNDVWHWAASKPVPTVTHFLQQGHTYSRNATPFNMPLSMSLWEDNYIQTTSFHSLDVLWSISWRCVTFVYAVEHLFNDAKMYCFLSCCICLTLWSCVTFPQTPEWSDNGLKGQYLDRIRTCGAARQRELIED